MPRAPSWGFEAAGDDGTGVFVRLTLLPDASIAWYWAYLFVPDLGLVVVRDHEVPLPRRSTPDLEVRAEALWAELVCETPGEHWGIGLEAFGVVLDDPRDALRGELGIRVPVGLDLEWEHLAPEYREGDEREHQFGRVHGEILVGPERIPFDATGAREVTRGDLRVEPGRHHAAFASGDAFAVDLASGSGDGAPVTGYVWRLGDALAPVHHVLAEARPAEPAEPVALRYVLDGELEIEAESVAHAVVPLTRGGSPTVTSYLLKTLASFVAGDRRGAGFFETIFPVGPTDAPVT
jgi:hypothetical protein